MKTIALIGLCLVSFGTFAQTESTKESKPAKVADAPKSPVTFETMVIERTDVEYDSKEPFVFKFKNTGKEPVLVTGVHTSCGCTAAEKPTEEVAKGKSSKIVVTYDTKRVGPFTKTITVTTNVSTEPIVLTIKGNVLPAPVVVPEAQPESPKM